MPALQRFAAILVADLRERTRSTRFWVVLLAVAAATWWFIPGLDAGYTTVTFEGQARGRYSSAWVGMVMAMEFSTLLSLLGFYLVRGTLLRDIETRVWQLLVATPMTRGGYLLAKWASHMAVFALVISGALVVALVAQFVRAEDRHVDLIELVKPSLLLSLPGLSITAMLAVWFDLVPWLRRTAGNVLFFVLWIALTSVSIARLESADPSADMQGWTSDPNGLVVLARDVNRVREARTGKEFGYSYQVGVQLQKNRPTLFEWSSWSPRPIDLLGRSLWMALALGGVLAASRLLDWAAARGADAGKARSTAGRQLRWLDRALDLFARGAIGRLAVAELKLVLRQRRLWWWLAVLGVYGMQAFGAPKVLQMGMLLAWVLPLDILARGVLRELDNGTGAMVFSAPGILARLLSARFVTGFGLLLMLTLPGLLQLASIKPMSAVAAIVVSAGIVVWGLCLGALCRNARPFELLLVGSVYAGLQGATLFELIAIPGTTALVHGLMLLPALAVLAVAWPRLARR